MSASKQNKETAIRHRNVFTGELVEEVIVKKPEPRRVQPQRRYYPQRQQYVYGDNDIVEWFKLNAPETLAEVEDLRRALKTRKRAGKYDITIIFTHTGKRLIKVWGPKCQVVIVSPSSRKLFNKKLRNREVYLEVLRDQFGQQ
jgi:hypothetical protein